MPFRQLMNDRVNLIKKSGKRFDDLPASVQSGMVFTQNPHVPIEDGDRFERQLPSGIVESFLILDAGFQQAFHGIPAHYQSKVRKESAVSESRVSSQIVYNLIGPNARVNIQSSDTSTNVVNVDTSALFGALRKTVFELPNAPELKERLSRVVDDMEATAGSHTFSERYKEFISLVADHITIFAPYMTALAQLLQ